MMIKCKKTRFVKDGEYKGIPHYKAEYNQHECRKRKTSPYLTFVILDHFHYFCPTCKSDFVITVPSRIAPTNPICPNCAKRFHKFVEERSNDEYRRK